MSNPNGVLLVYVSYCKTLACLIICEKVDNSMKGKEVLQRLLLARQLGFFLGLLRFYIIFRQKEKLPGNNADLCGCHENWPHSDSVDTGGFSWEKSVVLTWQEQPLLTLWGGWGKHVLGNEALFHQFVPEICPMRSKRKINRIIWILNLCLPLCKDKVRSPSLPSASTVTHNSCRVTTSDSISLVSKTAWELTCPVYNTTTTLPVCKEEAKSAKHY